MDFAERNKLSTSITHSERHHAKHILQINIDSAGEKTMLWIPTAHLHFDCQEESEGAAGDGRNSPLKQKKVGERAHLNANSLKVV